MAPKTTQAKKSKKAKKAAAAAAAVASGAAASKEQQRDYEEAMAEAAQWAEEDRARARKERKRQAAAADLASVDASSDGDDDSDESGWATPPLTQPAPKRRRSGNDSKAVSERLQQQIDTMQALLASTAAATQAAAAAAQPTWSDEAAPEAMKIELQFQTLLASMAAQGGGSHGRAAEVRRFLALSYTAAKVYEKSMKSGSARSEAAEFLMHGLLMFARELQKFDRDPSELKVKIMNIETNIAAYMATKDKDGGGRCSRGGLVGKSQRRADHQGDRQGAQLVHSKIGRAHV